MNPYVDTFSNDEEAEAILPTREAQMMELTVVRQQYEKERTRVNLDGLRFRRWDRVAYLHRCGQIRPEYEKQIVFIWWSALDITTPAGDAWIQSCSEELFNTPNPNCLIAWMSPKGLRFIMSDSDLLQHV